MKHSLSADDRNFRDEFETCRISAARFDHQAHIRLAYIYLAEHDHDAALTLIRSTLLGFLRHQQIDLSKYHETMTQAWILAVRHFMEISPACGSSDAFIECNPIMLDSKIMMTHYSAEVMFSPEARARYVEPDLERIPRDEP